MIYHTYVTPRICGLFTIDVEGNFVKLKLVVLKSGPNFVTHNIRPLIYFYIAIKRLKVFDKGRFIIVH